jgi:hypothetical protein
MPLQAHAEGCHGRGSSRGRQHRASECALQPWYNSSVKGGRALLLPPAEAAPASDDTLDCPPPVTLEGNCLPPNAPRVRPLVPCIVSIDLPHAYTKEPSMNLSRPDVFNVRFSPLERRLLEAIAGLEGQKLSEALRWLIREEARRRGLLTLISQEWQSGERAEE